MKNLPDIIKTWLKENPTVFQHRFDENILTLIELGSQKQISFDIRTIKSHRLTDHPQGKGKYLNLLFDNQTEIVLCYAGIAFTPSFVNTGPIPDAPPVSCMEDYYRLLSSLLTIRNEPDRKKESLLIFNILLSVLDGAKRVGLDVGREEEELDKYLTEFEKDFNI